MMGIEKLLLGLGVFGILAFGSCKQEINTPSDITINVKSQGTIKGKVTWDYNKDGVYTGVAGTDVCLDKVIYLMPKYSTKSAAGGVFSFQDIPTGTYEVWVSTITYEPYQYWRTVTGVTVTKQEVVDMGEIKLEPHNGAGY